MCKVERLTSVADFLIFDGGNGRRPGPGVQTAVGREPKGQRGRLNIGIVSFKLFYTSLMFGSTILTFEPGTVF